MSSRRPFSDDKMASPSASIEDRIVDSTSPQEGSSIAPAVPVSVVVKLLVFTFAMFAAPIGIYFATVDRVFGGKSNYAGALAAFTANVVLVGYIIVAVREDQGESTEATQQQQQQQQHKKAE